MTVATAEVARSDPRLACAHFSLLRRGTPNRYIAPTFHNRSPEIAHALNFVSALPRNSRPSEQSGPFPSVLAAEASNRRRLEINAKSADLKDARVHGSCQKLQLRLEMGCTTLLKVAPMRPGAHQ